jgi:hypothetical protein
VLLKRLELQTKPLGASKTKRTHKRTRRVTTRMPTLAMLQPARRELLEVRTSRPSRALSTACPPRLLQKMPIRTDVSVSRLRLYLLFDHHYGKRYQNPQTLRSMDETIQAHVKAFSVQGDTFVNKGAALQRSCAVQHNGWSVCRKEPPRATTKLRIAPMLPIVGDRLASLNVTSKRRKSSCQRDCDFCLSLTHEAMYHCGCRLID